MWTTAEKWLDHELGLDDRTGFTRRQCTTMRKLCRPSEIQYRRAWSVPVALGVYRQGPPYSRLFHNLRFASYLFLFVPLRDRRMSDLNFKPSAERGDCEGSDSADSRVKLQRIHVSLSLRRG